MAQLVINDIEDEVVERLRARAQAERKSLEQKLRDVLREAATSSRADVLAEMRRIRAMTPRPLTTDSAELIREDRDRR